MPFMYESQSALVLSWQYYSQKHDTEIIRNIEQLHLTILNLRKAGMQVLEVFEARAIVSNFTKREKRAPRFNYRAL